MTFIKNLKPRNVYEKPYDKADYSNCQLNPKAAVLRYVPESELKVEEKNKLVTLAGFSEKRVGRLIYEFVKCGSKFQETWNGVEPGDFALILVAAGDSVGDYVFVEADDVWAVWCPEQLSDSPLLGDDHPLRSPLIIAR